MGNALFVKTQQLLPELLFLTLQVREVRSVSVLTIFIGQNGDALGFSSHNLDKIVHEQHELFTTFTLGLILGITRAMIFELLTQLGCKVGELNHPRAI